MEFHRKRKKVVRTISIDPQIDERLGIEKNASELINWLVEEYFFGDNSKITTDSTALVSDSEINQKIKKTTQEIKHRKDYEKLQTIASFREVLISNKSFNIHTMNDPLERHTVKHWCGELNCTDLQLFELIKHLTTEIKNEVCMPREAIKQIT